MQRKSAFSRRLPDHVTEELVAVLLRLLDSRKAALELKQRSKRDAKDASDPAHSPALKQRSSKKAVKEDGEGMCLEPPKKTKSPKGACIEFKQLFDYVYDNLRQRGLASGGEEMLRLRAYEKLQILVGRGMVKKNGKTYEALPTLVNALTPATDGPPPPSPSVASATK